MSWWPPDHRHRDPIRHIISSSYNLYINLAAINTEKILSIFVLCLEREIKHAGIFDMPLFPHLTLIVKETKECRSKLSFERWIFLHLSCPKYDERDFYWNGYLWTDGKSEEWSKEKFVPVSLCPWCPGYPWYPAPLSPAAIYNENDTRKFELSPVIIMEASSRHNFILDTVIWQSRQKIGRHGASMFCTDKFQLRLERVFNVVL